MYIVSSVHLSVKLPIPRSTTQIHYSDSFSTLLKKLRVTSSSFAPRFLQYLQNKTAMTSRSTSPQLPCIYIVVFLWCFSSSCTFFLYSTYLSVFYFYLLLQPHITRLLLFLIFLLQASSASITIPSCLFMGSSYFIFLKFIYSHYLFCHVLLFSLLSLLVSLAR